MGNTLQDKTVVVVGRGSGIVLQEVAEGRGALEDLLICCLWVLGSALRR